MALLELRQGHCQACGCDVLLQVYWPYATMFRRLVQAGSLQEFDGDDLEAMLADALSVDEAEQGPDGDLDTAALFAATMGHVFVDGRKEQAVTCPECGALVGVLAKPRAG